MNLCEHAKKYYLEKGTNCAVALLLGGSDFYDLGLNAEDAKIITGFGGGIGCGATCGCLAGSVGVLGKLFAGREDFRKICASFVAVFKEGLGSLDCLEITPRFMNKETRCAGAVVRCAELLEEYVKGVQ